MPSFSGARWDREDARRKQQRVRDQQALEAEAADLPVLDRGDAVCIKKGNDHRRYQATVMWRTRLGIKFKMTDTRWQGEPVLWLSFPEIARMVTRRD